MLIIKNYFKAPIQKFLRYKAKSSIQQLSLHNSEKIRAIGNALSETLSNSLSPKELEFINLVEKRRLLLLSTEKKISVIDYGAGKSRLNRTKEEMENGIESSLKISDICRASKQSFWATFLFKLVRKLKPVSCVELGSCVGISASYLAAALKINGKGNLVTLEGSPEVAKIAQETLEVMKLKEASVVTGPFHKTLSNVLETSKPIDFFFNDGHHDHNAVINYFIKSLPNLSNEAVIIFDDISWSSGMRKAWTQIENDERVSTSIDLRDIGIVLIGNKSATKDKFRIPLK